MATILRPLGNRVLVKRDEAADRTESGLYLPAQAKEAPGRGTIISLGSGCNINKEGQPVNDPLKVGDKVVFLKYAGADVEVDKEKLLLLTTDDLIAVIETVPDKKKSPADDISIPTGKPKK